MADHLSLTEWHPAIWLGRLFMLDNDYGEHWLDNWDARDALADEARTLGLQPEELMIVLPERFQNGADGPCHPSAIRRQFWTDVLKSLTISYDLLFAVARHHNERLRHTLPEAHIADLEQRIATLQSELDDDQDGVPGRRLCRPAPRPAMSQPPNGSAG